MSRKKAGAMPGELPEGVRDRCIALLSPNSCPLLRALEKDTEPA
jgi:hypothetical protein